MRLTEELVFPGQQTLFEERPLCTPSHAVWELAERGIFIGTAGYSYEDWIGTFYPANLKRSAMLDYYRRFFPVLELNSSFYNIPTASMLYQMCNKAPRMQLAVKANKMITHDRKRIYQDWQYFTDALSVLADMDRLTAVLFQFPFNFRCNKENREYLDEVMEFFHFPSKVVEFRNGDWVNPETLSYCRNRGITLCSVDSPHWPGLTYNLVHPGPVFSYYRLNGRNVQNWFSGDRVSRYNYSYSPSEIADIVKYVLALRATSERVYVFAKNHPNGQSVQAAAALATAVLASLKGTKDTPGETRKEIATPPRRLSPRLSVTV